MNSKKAKLVRKLVRAQLGVDRIEGGYVARTIMGWLVNRAHRCTKIVQADGSVLSLGKRVRKQQAFLHPTSPRRHYKTLKRKIQGA